MKRIKKFVVKKTDEKDFLEIDIVGLQLFTAALIGVFIITGIYFFC